MGANLDVEQEWWAIERVVQATTFVGARKGFVYSLIGIT